MFSERSLSWMILVQPQKGTSVGPGSRERVALRCCVGFFVSMTTPHHATKKYRDDIHFISFSYEVFSTESAILFSIR